MGHCFLDLEGGKQVVGGAQQRPTSANDGGHNDAVDFFYRSRGLQPLFTQIEVLYQYLMCMCTNCVIVYSVPHTRSESIQFSQFPKLFILLALFFFFKRLLDLLVLIVFVLTVSILMFSVMLSSTHSATCF